MTLLNKIKSIDWKYVVSRREALLFKSITDNSQKYFEKLTNINWSPRHILRLHTGELLHSAKKLEELRNFFIKGGTKALSKFKNDLIKNVNNLDKKAKEIREQNLSKATTEKLARILKEYFQKALYAQNFLLPMPVADGALSKMILDKLPSASDDKKKEWLTITNLSPKRK